MTKLFNNVQASEAGNVTKKVAKLDNETKFENATKLEKIPDFFETVETVANKEYEKLAFSCFVKSLKSGLKNDPNRQTLAKLFIKSYRLTKGFTVILTESENKDGNMKECTKVNGKTFWHKCLPQKTPHFYLSSLKSGVKVAKQIQIVEKKREKVLSFDQLFSTKYSAIANILTPEQRDTIYQDYLNSLNIDND